MAIGQQIQVGSSMFYQTGSRSQAEWENASKQLLDEGRVFFAYDLAKTALEHFPGSLKLKHVMALVLLRTGAIGEARKILESLCVSVQPDETVLLRTYSLVRRALSLITKEDREEGASPETIEALVDLYKEIGRVGELKAPPLARDEETLGLLARVYKESWKQTGVRDEAFRSREAYLRAFEATGGYWTGINAAAMSWILGEKVVARDLAARVLKTCEGLSATRGQESWYWVLATMGEAHLYLGAENKAIEAYQEAVKHAGSRHAQIMSSFQQFNLLRDNGFPVPPQLFEILKPPTVVIFTGHMIDGPDRGIPRFPAVLETIVRKKIDFHLDALAARIGYCSAACGSDLLFIEAMHDRGSEVNIILPFHLDDFKTTSLRHAGENWLRRFDNALKLASSVRYVTEERYLNDEVLFDFTDRILMGHAFLRAHTLETKPHLLAVWDGQTANAIGGTASNIARWSCPASGGNGICRSVSCSQTRRKVPCEKDVPTPSPRIGSQS